MRQIPLLLIALLFLAPRSALSAEVTAWVPWYGIAGSKAVLQNTYGGIPVDQVVSRVGLQFWNITSVGKVELLSLDSSAPALVTDADVRWFVDWGATHNVKILLTVVNNGQKENGYASFDWRLVRSACYGTRADTTIRNLLAIVDSLDLGGVDLDLEGELAAGGPFTPTDDASYAPFVGKLADSLHARNMLLTVDAYPTESSGGAPRPSWFSSWVDKADAIHGMGYFADYWSAPGANGYQAQQDVAMAEGLAGNVLQLGMPMWLNAWAGDQSGTGVRHIDNLNYVLNCMEAQTGVTLWDIHHPSVATVSSSTPEAFPWTQDSVWILMKAIRDGVAPDTSRCPHLTNNPKVIDDFTNKGVNLGGGLWAASSDFWSRSATTRAAEGTEVLNAAGDHDMVAGYGSWGDIGKGYVDLGSQNVFQMIVKSYNTANGGTYGGVVMNFLPVDVSQDPTAQSWEVAKVGVERDLSAFDSLMVGVQCELGKQVRVSIDSKAWLLARTAGAYGKSFDCTGEFQDLALKFAELTPVWGSGPTGFDAAHALRLMVDWIDPAPPAAHAITLLGVAVDTSVVALRAGILASVPVIDKSVAAIADRGASPTGGAAGVQLLGGLDRTGFVLRSAVQELELRAMDGRLVERQMALSAGRHGWSRAVAPGLYLVRARSVAGVAGGPAIEVRRTLLF
jgi:hypothetical protein